jgi:hypothetical protein
MVVLQTAVTPVSSEMLNFSVRGADYVVLGFSEFNSTESHNMSVYLNGSFYYLATAPHLERNNFFSGSLSKENMYEFSLTSAMTTGARPILNSFENFIIMTTTDGPNGPTNKQDGISLLSSLTTIAV